MSILIVGIGECKASNVSDDIIKTFALGSCVGVIAFARRKGAAGLLHIALPESKINPELAASQPGRFADTAIPCLLQAMEKYGCQPQDLTVKLAGGASILDDEQHFAIGKRNVIAVKKNLWKYKLGAIAEDVGDSYSRTVTVQPATGRVILSSPKIGEWEL